MLPGFPLYIAKMGHCQKTRVGALARCTVTLGTLGRVTSSDEVRVTLDLARHGEVIHGSVSGFDDGPHPFFGWIELADALEALRTSKPLGLPLGAELRGVET